MPTYDYHCSDCDKSFNVILSITEHEKTPPLVCPECGSKKIRQVFSGVTVITSKKS
ncbi:MAG: zinc ribbon domain-containing protein [Bacteroidota bacterium]